jgi:nucleotidyltransferase substrate binding protein (TIGR01987 family)
MSNDKRQLAFKKLAHALNALEVMVSKVPDADRGVIDASIQRFEFTIELFWKLLKVILQEKGLEVQFPKDILKEAFQGRLIDDETLWLSMLNDRNLTSHTYDEKLADLVYGRIKRYTPVFRRTYDALKQNFDR